MKSPHKFKQGDKFGRLTCLRFERMGNHHRSYWMFRCDCGVEKVIHGSAVSSGNTRSCGCLSREAKAKTRIPNGHSEITAIILQYKRHAKSRGYPFHLSRDAVSSLVRSPCVYCGVKSSCVMLTKNTIEPLHYNGIDRIDNSKGYTRENSVSCCKTCNTAKSDMTIEKFHEWAMRIGKMASQWGGKVEAVAA